MEPIPYARIIMTDSAEFMNLMGRGLKRGIAKLYRIQNATVNTSATLLKHTFHHFDPRPSDEPLQSHQGFMRTSNFAISIAPIISIDTPTKSIKLEI